MPFDIVNIAASERLKCSGFMAYMSLSACTLHKSVPVAPQ